MPFKDPKKRKKYNKEYHKEYRRKNAKKLAAYRKKHRKRIATYLRDWRKRNPEYDKLWRFKNRKKKCKNQQTYRRAHPEKIRVFNAVYATKKTQAGGSFTEKQWLTLCKEYDNRCLCCGRKRKLTPDHIIPVSKGGTSNIRNIQPLCQPCNSSKNAKTTDYRKRKPCLRRYQKILGRA